MKITHNRNVTLKKICYRFWVRITIPLVELNRLLYYGQIRKNRKVKLNIILRWKKYLNKIKTKQITFKFIKTKHERFLKYQ